MRAMQEGIATGLASFEARAAADPLALAVGEETDRRHFDLVIHAMPLRGADTLAERLLGAGDHSVLLIPLDADHGARASASGSKASNPDQGPPRVPLKAVIGVAVGEPAKEDILFAGRLIRHLGSEVTIMTVLPEQHFEAERRQAERFLQAGMRTLSLLGVTSKTVLRHGNVRDEVMAEMDEGNADLLVLGAPLPDERGRLNLHGVTGDLIAAASDRPILIVRSHPGEPWRP